MEERRLYRVLQTFNLVFQLLIALLSVHVRVVLIQSYLVVNGDQLLNLQL